MSSNSNAPHRILVVGVGSIGERHARCFQKTGRVEVGICETNPKLRDDVAARYQIKSVHSDLKEALKEKWNGTVIATPANTHTPLAQIIADAKVNFLLEKPMALEENGISKMMQTVEANHLVACMGYVHRAIPGLQKFRDLLLSGRFGKPAQLIVVSGQNFPFFRPAYRTIYYTDRSKGGGAIQDALTHMIDAGQFLLGSIDTLNADADHQVLEGVTVEDTVHVMARHKNVMATYSLNQFQAPNEITFTLNCDKGTLRYEPTENRIRWMTEPCSTWQEETWPKLDRDDPFINQANIFLDAIEGKRPVLCTLQEGLQALRANVAIYESSQNQGIRKTLSKSH